MYTVETQRKNRRGFITIHHESNLPAALALYTQVTVAKGYLKRLRGKHPENGKWRTIARERG